MVAEARDWKRPAVATKGMAHSHFLLAPQFACPLRHVHAKRLLTSCAVIPGGHNRPRRHHNQTNHSRFVPRRRAAGMAVAGIVGEAVKGAVREAWTAQGVAPVQRAVIFFSLLALIVRTALGNLTLARYGAHAYWLHATLKPWGKELAEKKAASGGGSKARNSNNRRNVVVARNVRFGRAQRNLLDVYVSSNRKLKGEGLKPVVIFVHGGVWASGDKWQFSPLGTFLAEEGVVAVLVQYTLYPEALAKHQVGEVSDALTWTMDNIAHYGGDLNRVFLMGHSSGAHLCAMVLWERASRRVDNAQQQQQQQRHLRPLDLRIPHGFLGLAGVYNIGEHFKYEVGRGVGAISCMRPANGWEPHFDSMSPSLLFESLLLHEGIQFVAADGDTVPPTPTMRGSDLVPRCLLIASDRDVTVPPSSSVALHTMLQTLGCESRVAMHHEMAHEDFCLWHRGSGALKSHIGPFLEEIFGFVNLEA